MGRLILLLGLAALLGVAACDRRYGYGGSSGGRGGWGGSPRDRGDRVYDPIPVPSRGQPAPPANHQGN